MEKNVKDRGRKSLKIIGELTKRKDKAKAKETFNSVVG
jgi:hypothetical protein